MKNNFQTFLKFLKLILTLLEFSNLIKIEFKFNVQLTLNYLNKDKFLIT